MSEDLPEDEIQSVVEKYQEIMMVVGKKQALREIQETQIDIESLSEKQKYIITHAPFADEQIQYDSEMIEAGTVGDLLEPKQLIFLRRLGAYQGSVLDLTKKGLICRAILLVTENHSPEYTYEEKARLVR